MKISQKRNGDTTLTLNNDELGFFAALMQDDIIKKDGFTAGLLNHSDVDAMAAQLSDWQEYKRLCAKFNPPSSDEDGRTPGRARQTILVGR